MEKYKCIPGKRLALKIAFQYWSITGWWYLHLKQYSRCYLKAVILWEWYSTTDRGVMEFYQMLQKMSSVSDEQLSCYFGTGISTCLLFVISCHQGLSPFSLFLSHLRKRNENPERRGFFSLEGSSEKYIHVRTFTLVEYFGSPSAKGLHHSFSGLTT